VGFGEEPGGMTHRFTPEEIGWLQLFANSTATAIRQATEYTKMRDQARLLANLHSVAERLVSIPEDPDLLRHIAWGTLNILGADVVTIYQFREFEDLFENRFVIPPAIAGRLRKKRELTTPMPLTATPALIVQKALEQRFRGKPIEPLYARRSRLNRLMNPNRKRRKTFVRREGIVSSAAVPLVTGNVPEQEIVGILFVNYRRPHSFPDTEKEIIETLASTAAVAIKNWRLLGVFRDADSRIIDSQDVDRVLGLIVRQAVEFSRADYGEVQLFDPLRQRLAERCRYPADSEVTEEREGYTTRRAVERWVLAKREPALIRDYATDDRCQVAGAKSGSESCIPLIDHERILGTLRVVSRSPGTFQARHLSTLVGFANRAVLAVLVDETRNKLKTNEKLATLGGLTGTVLHRLKTELEGISIYFDQLKTAKGAGNVQRALEMADKVVAMTDSFGKQVNRIRDWSDPDRRRVSLEEAARGGLAVVDVPENVGLEIDLPMDLPMVMADSALLAELFGILVKNAVEAMPKGGQLRIHRRCQELVEENWVVVQVQDTGTGMDELTVGTLFQPKHSAKRGGLGIGLWLAHSYIELLGGRLDVETELGRGSTFLVGLPAVPSNGAAGGVEDRHAIARDVKGKLLTSGIG
jgi:signal transduction histidine kinase